MSRFLFRRAFCIKMPAKCRENPLILKLDTPEFHSILTEEVKTLKNIFDKYNYELRLAGGPVRDLLTGIRPKDLDFATPAVPEQIKAMFQAEGIRMINVNGEKHGTITARINDKENFEVTTLRIDIVTDGRHAQVQFTNDWKLDANRRDLTVNSMFLDFDGSVYDYFYGYEDLMAKKLAFVGDTEKRIKEDYLRILRYFRFYGRISEIPDNHEAETLLCIKENSEGLKRISGERIWMELKKILAGKFSGELLKTMLHLDLGKYMGLPEKPNLAEMETIYNGKYGKSLHPITLITSLLNNIDDVVVLNDRLKFSTYDRDLAFFIVEHRFSKTLDRTLLKYQKILLNSKAKHNITREYIIELLKYQGEEHLLNSFEKWNMPKFYHIPVSMLNKHGATIPKYYAIIMNELKNLWAEKNFEMSIEEIEKEIPNIASKYEHLGNIRRNVKN